MLGKTLGSSLLVLVFLFDVGTSVPSIRNGNSNNFNGLDSKDNRKCVLTNTPPDPSSNCCGVQAKTKQKRSVGGEETLLTEYPWIVILEYPHIQGSLDLLCAGVLISGRHVVTAAHCIKNDRKPENVRLGVHDRIAKGYNCMTVEEGRKVCNDGTTSIPIRKITVHPEYNHTDSWHNDIAIVELEKIAPYTDFIRPICLPSSDVTSNSRGLKFHFAGWGSFYQVFSSIRKVYRFAYFREKLKVMLPYKSNQECQREFDQHIKTKVTIRNTNICAGGEYLKGPCQGDSGGPLMYDNNGVFEAAGVFSFGPVGPCGMKDVPAAFTKIYEYQTWIRTVIDA